MPRVDFYVLAESNPPNRFACAMAGRALQERMPVYIHTRSRDEATLLDSLLWTFRDISFIPHALVDEPGAHEAPVALGWQGAVPDRHGVLINLSDAVPEFAGRFERIVEPVGMAAEQKSRARERFRHYRELGWELHSHDI